jgi:glutaredoxin 3
VLVKKITVYTMNYCPYCDAAKRLLKANGMDFEEIKVGEDDDATWKRLEKQTGFKTMPQIFIGEEFVGGFNELKKLEDNGELARKVQ